MNRQPQGWPSSGRLRATLMAGVGLLMSGTILLPSAPADGALGAFAPTGLTGCAARNVPSGFVLDGAHSGSINPSQYSASGDIQASLIFDHYRHGLRAVYTDLGTSTSNPNHDLVIECIALQFSTPANANRFFQSFEYLRTQAASIVNKVPLPGHLPGDAVGYRETQQAFSGYHITSTTVMELADQHGDHVYDVSVAGSNPLRQTAFRFLKVLIGKA